ncbi:MAG: hypothetical protein WBE72_06040 [Terracidiphilus sp.]
MPGYGGRAGYIAPGYGGYIAPGYGLADSYYPWFPDDSGYDDSSAAPSQPAEGYDAEPQYPLPPEPPGIYPPAAAGPNPASLSSTNDEGVTLVFKDGRAPVQIHDYVLTHNTLYVWDSRQFVIPTDQLDLAATAKANQDAGIDFRPPEAPK